MKIKAPAKINLRLKITGLCRAEAASAAQAGLRADTTLVPGPGLGEIAEALLGSLLY